MSTRFISIWFRHLKTDWFCRRNPQLKDQTFVLASLDHGRMIVTAASQQAEAQGIYVGLSLADARALYPPLQVMNDEPELTPKLLKAIAAWCIRFTPSVAVDDPNGLILDVTGCAHLWGSEKNYLTDIITRIKNFGYDVRASMADTIGVAWGVARYGAVGPIVESTQHMKALLTLPSAALRLQQQHIERLEKLGLRQVSQFISMPRTALRRRFGAELLLRLDQATGKEPETIIPLFPVEPFHERLPCMEPIVTATGIEIALKRLLEAICPRLRKEEKGLRIASFKGYRVDGITEQIEIGTNHPSSNPEHLFKLFENKICNIEPALGIELFTLEAGKVEDVSSMQEELWATNGGLADRDLCELLDRIAGKIGGQKIKRFIPDEHYWPERSFRQMADISETMEHTWPATRPRPMHVLTKPQPIEVTAPIPDYPPMMFRYKGKLHKIIKADGPERIEQEWWLQQGQHRDYYYVEDEAGQRYWIFRLGHYDAAKSYQWFMHGFFA